MTFLSIKPAEPVASRSFRKAGTAFRHGFAFLGVSLMITCSLAQAWDWVPTDEDMRKYRQSWNPFSNGPMFISGVDIHPKGQFTAHPFIFSQVSEKRFGNQLSTNRSPAVTHTYQLAPVVTMAYGLTDHLEFNLGVSGSAFWARSTSNFNQGGGGPWTTDAGLGDTQLYLKYRPVVQDPGG